MAISKRASRAAAILLTAIVMTGFFFSSAYAAKKVSINPLPDKLDVNSMAPLLEKGELAFVLSNSDGTFRQVDVMGMIDAPPAKVWSVITDYEHYPQIMPRAANIKVLGHEGNDWVVAYEIEIPGPNFKYTLKHHHIPPYRVDIEPENDKGDVRTGGWRWELYPYEGGEKTIIIYYLITDIRETSWLMKQALNADQTMEHALNMSTGLVTVRAVKRWAEKQ